MAIAVRTLIVLLVVRGNSDDCDSRVYSCSHSTLCCRDGGDPHPHRSPPHPPERCVVQVVHTIEVLHGAALFRLCTPTLASPNIPSAVVAKPVSVSTSRLVQPARPSGPKFDVVADRTERGFLPGQHDEERSETAFSIAVCTSKPRVESLVPVLCPP